MYTDFNMNSTEWNRIIRREKESESKREKSNSFKSIWFLDEGGQKYEAGNHIIPINSIDFSPKFRP